MRWGTILGLRRIYSISSPHNTTLQGEETTQSTTQFGGAFTTGSTKNAAGEVVTELGRETTETLTEVLTPASLPVTGKSEALASGSLFL